MANPLRMPVGTSAKEVAEKLICENPECGKETDLLYEIMEPKGSTKVCESCFQKYWLGKGYKV